MKCYVCNTNAENETFCPCCRVRVRRDTSGNQKPIKAVKTVSILFDKDYEIGTKVRVMRKDVDENSGRETVREIHKGRVIDYTGSHLRVFNPEPVDRGGDPSPDMAQLYAIKSNRIWVEKI